MDPDYDEVYTAVAKGRGLMLVDANGKGIPLTVSRIEEALSWLSEQPTPALLRGWQLLLGAVETDICVAVIRFAPRLAMQASPAELAEIRAALDALVAETDDEAVRVAAERALAALDRR